MYRAESELEIGRESCACKTVTLMTKPKFGFLSWVFGSKKKRRYSSHSDTSVEYYQPRSNHSSRRSSSVNRSSRSSSVTYSLGSRKGSRASRRYSSVKYLDTRRTVQQSSLQQQQRSLLDNLWDLFDFQVSE